ncbi:MAG: TolC family protein [Planctomycetes bacterium]|nr:TolC family protein [Planctomycetota bacterium]
MRASLPTLPPWILGAALLAACAGPDRSPPSRSHELAPQAVPRPLVSEDPRALPPGPLGPRALLDALARRNPSLASARARIDGASALLDQAEAALRPRLELSTALMRSDAPSTFLFQTIDAHRLAPGQDFNHPGTFDALQAGAAFRWNLWRGGQDALARDAAADEVSARASDAFALENALASAAIAAWLDARAAAELLSADDASLASLRAQLEDARSRVAAGSALRSDELTLAVRVSEAEERRLRTDSARKLALAALRALLALPPNTPIELAADGADDALELGLLPRAEESARDEAWRVRPELTAVRRRLDAARAARASAERAWMPSLDAEARAWAVDEHGGLDAGTPNAEARLALSWVLLDGGGRRGAARGRDAELRALEHERERLELAIGLEIEAAWIGLEEAEARRTVTAGALAAAEETLVLVESQFRGGAAPVTRFLEAEADRTRARAEAVRARIDVQRARAELARALGRFAPGSKGVAR